MGSYNYNRGSIARNCGVSTMLFAILVLAFQAKTEAGKMSDPSDFGVEPLNETNGLTADNTTQHEFVNVSIKMMLQNDLVIDLPVNSLQDVATQQRLIGKLKDGIEMVIERQSKQPIVLHLKRNRLIIPKGFTSKHFTNHGKPVTKRSDQRYQSSALCFYTGKVQDEAASLASINICEGVSGVIEMLEHKYSLQSIIHGSKIEHELVKENILENRRKRCDTNDYTSGSYRHPDKIRLSRSASLPAGQTSDTNYIELYVVMDNSLYRRAGSVDATIMRAINMVNYASALYRQLNIYLALVGVEVWNDQDKIPYTLARGSRNKYNADALLAEFNKYRMYNINQNTPNDNGQLFTAVDFDGGVYGKGFTGGICSYASSGGVTSDGTAINYSRAASTMAHELGHNLRMSHSDDENAFPGQNCSCEYPDNPEFKSCIMHSTFSRPFLATKWSPCTKNELRANLRANLGHCLRNKPAELYKAGNTPICGNYFVEEGEECDCGQPADCTSKCCDASTCKLRANATCATGACCDADSCSIRPRSTPCRPIQDGECDLAEFCDGTSEWCPADTYKRDGTPCMNRDHAYCYAGKCKSRDSQCHFVWGLPSSRSSDDFCYQQFNGRARYYGNCGWNATFDGETTPYLRRQFHSCAKEEDKFCGLLHCQGNSTQHSSFRNPAIINLVLVKLGLTSNGHICDFVSFDVGYKEYDPGQVPNGAKCGDNSMCVNSVCVQVPAAPDSCHCNGHGVCNQHGECHCDLGWALPYCDTSIASGSWDSSSNTIV